MAGKDFKVEIPLGASGTGKGGASGNNGGGNDKKETNKLLKKLDKSIIATFDPIEILTSAFKDVIQLLQPLIKILSLLFLVIFLPLMPLIALLVKGIAAFVKLLSGGFGGIAAFLGKIILGILLAALAVFLAPLVAGAAGIAVVIALVIAALSLFWSALEDAFIFIAKNIMDVANWIWDFIVSGFQSLGDLATLIWEFIKGLFKGTIDVVSMVWEFLKTLFKGTISVIDNVWDFIKGLFKGTVSVATTVWKWFKGLFGGGRGGVEGRASGGSVNAGQTYMVGENGPELFTSKSGGSIIPNGSIGGSTININNPSVRNDSDVKKIANEVSKVLQRQTNGRFSK